MSKFLVFFQIYDEEEDTKTQFLMHIVPFVLQTSKTYRLQSKYIKQMFTAILNNEENEAIRLS